MLSKATHFSEGYNDVLKKCNYICSGIPDLLYGKLWASANILYEIYKW